MFGLCFGFGCLGLLLCFSSLFVFSLFCSVFSCVLFVVWLRACPVFCVYCVLLCLVGVAVFCVLWFVCGLSHIHN